MGSLGIAKDTPFHELPLNIWSDGKNVRFYEGMVESFLGDILHLTPSQQPRLLYFVKTPTLNAALVYLSLTDAFAVSSAVETEITRLASDYAATDNTPWSATYLSGIPVFNNYVDLPQYWSPVSLAQRLQNLPNWNATHRCKVIRAFKEFLVALHIKKGTTEYPYMVKWSHAADPGAVPSSWDEADPTKLAGEKDIGDSPGYLVDCLEMGDINVIYKEDAVWSMAFIGGRQVFQFRKLFPEFGIFGPGCVVGFERKHAVLSADDFIIHDGAKFISALSRSWRRELFGRMDQTNKHHTFLFANTPKKEIWICYPTSGKEWCTEALVWNWKEGTVGIRELSDVSSIVLADLSVDDSWNAQTQTWDTATEPWDPTLLNFLNKIPFMAKASTTYALRKMETGNTLAGVAKTSKVERLGWAIDGGKSADGSPRCDIGSVKLVKTLYPKVECSDFSKLKFYVGSQMFVDGPVTWSGPLTIDQTTGYKLDYTVSARLIGLRIESTDDVFWRLWGLSVDVEKESEH